MYILAFFNLSWAHAYWVLGLGGTHLTLIFHLTLIRFRAWGYPSHASWPHGYFFLNAKIYENEISGTNGLVNQKRKFSSLRGSILTGTNGFCRCQQPMDFWPCLGPMNFRLCLEPVDIPVRRYWIFAFGWKEWICVIGFASRPGPIDFRICPGSVNFYSSNWESIHTATTH